MFFEELVTHVHTHLHLADLALHAATPLVGDRRNVSLVQMNQQWTNYACTSARDRQIRLSYHITMMSVIPTHAEGCTTSAERHEGLVL